MSRSNPTQSNPARYYYRWSGSKGELSYYDKEKQVEVPVELPFHFLVLDELATITGFCEQDGSQYWSNEVRSVAREELIVKTSAGTKQTGLYKDLADVRSKGAKYAKSIYIAHYDGHEMVIANIKAHGAALTAWIELSSRHKVENGKVVLTGTEKGKKGATEYFIPKFEYQASDPQDDEKAIELDRQLQQHLSQYLTKRTTQSELDSLAATYGDGLATEDIDSLDLSAIPF